MAVDVGEVVMRPVLVRNSSGVAVNADATPTYTVTLPDGSAGTPPAVQTGAVGEYWVNYTTTVAGVHEDRWTALVSGVQVRFGPDSFRVRGTSSAPLLPLAEAREVLGLGPDVIRDEGLRDDLDAATRAIERATGYRYRRTTVTDEEHVIPDGQERAGIVLRAVPVTTLTQVTIDGTVIDATSYYLDKRAGVLTRRGGRWCGLVEVTYTAAGTGVVDDDVIAAVRLKLMHLRSLRQGGTGAPRRQAGGPDPLAVEVERAVRALPRAGVVA